MGVKSGIKKKRWDILPKLTRKIKYQSPFAKSICYGGQEIKMQNDISKFKKNQATIKDKRFRRRKKVR